jgi:hypothetical protein
MTCERAKTARGEERLRLSKVGLKTLAVLRDAISTSSIAPVDGRSYVMSPRSMGVTWATRLLQASER